MSGSVSHWNCWQIQGRLPEFVATGKPNPADLQRPLGSPSATLQRPTAASLRGTPRTPSGCRRGNPRMAEGAASAATEFPTQSRHLPRRAFRGGRTIAPMASVEVGQARRGKETGQRRLCGLCWHASARRLPDGGEF
jgi:hypothetical protein